VGQSKEEKVHQVFQSIYKNYDIMNNVISFKMHKAWRRDTMGIMNIPKGAHALDLCCGTCDWTIALSQEVGSLGKVVGLDFSENMLKVGREKITKKNLDNVELFHGNAMDLPFMDNQFDYVTIGFGLRNTADYKKVLKEIYRVLKPNGKIFCLDMSHPEFPGYRQLYFFYLQRIMPLFGKIFAKSYGEYSWLQESTMAFPSKQALAHMFKDVGFSDIKIKSYAGGAVALHHGIKGSR
jgi:demethylmenaquinone methyltransferase / 2-methoxy-6-polyprenyl-1,4-benzoquinol methylase